ncbi:hypothetical protein [Aequorivita nionensis]|uniref:hypothetical protein n=1 Tax=Aequorivita nionensis TaxID=1287690 RepID=UPI00396596C0
MKKLFLLFSFMLLPTFIYAQEKWLFIGYDEREEFSSLCNKQTANHGGVWVYNNENYTTNKKAVIEKLRETKGTEITEIACVQGENKTIAIVKSSVYCSNAKRSYDYIRFLYGNSIESIKEQIKKNEEMHKDQKLKQTIIKTLNFDTIVTTLDKNAQIIKL